MYPSRLSSFIGPIGALLTLLTGSASFAADDTEAPGALQEIVVTGSRIPVPANITSTSPITIVSRDEIQLGGHTDVSDFINKLPQNFVNSGTDFGNNSNPLSAAGGITTVDLRALGPQRTLVLVDGRRLGNGDPNTANPNPAPDIDQIPAALIERVDVVTGGASATYGSDAIAGVVNFIMRRNFEGVEVDGQYGFNDHHNHDGFIEGQERAVGLTPPQETTRNGYRRDLSLVVGTNTEDGNGNVTGYFTFHHQDPVQGNRYDYSDCLFENGVCNDGTNSNRFTVAGTQNRFTVVGNQFLPWPQAGSVPPATFNSSAYEFGQREDDRYMGGLMAHATLNDRIKPYLEFSFMNDKTTETVAPSGLFTGGNPFTADNNYLVNCGNPFLSAQQLGVLRTQGACLSGSPTENADLIIGRRNVEGGGRQAYFEHTNYRGVAGVGGNIVTGWTYDAYVQYYYTTLFNSNSNYLNYASIANALQVTGTAAAPVCISGSPCVPYNIFSQGGVTQAQLNYLYTPGTSYGSNREKIIHADVTGDLGVYDLRSPWANDAPGLNVGFEHRFEGLSFAPDGAELAGDLAGFSGAAVAIDAGYNVSEGFTELRVPIAQAVPWAEDLSMDSGYRYSKYSTAGVTNTYKFEVQWAPFKDVRFRGSLDRAVRAPNLIELYNPQSYGQQSFVGLDPCAPTLVNGVVMAATASLTQCEHTGVTAAQYGNGGTSNTISQCVANQCGGVIGGNPNLKPETARTWSVGASFTPQFLPNFLATLDYYRIALSGEVGSIPGAYLFNQCLDNGNAADCSQVVRSPSGALHGATVAGGGYILQTAINTGAALVSGIDLGLNYQYRLEHLGTLIAAMNGTYVQHNVVTPYPGATSYDCAGLFGVNCFNDINPRWKHTLRLSWDTPWHVLLSANWRFLGPTSYDNNSSNPAIANSEEGSYDPGHARIPRFNYLDLTAVVHVSKGLELRMGVTNLLDKDPPLLPAEITNEIQSNTFLAYDQLGRELFAAFTAKF